MHFELSQTFHPLPMEAPGSAEAQTGVDIRAVRWGRLFEEELCEEGEVVLTFPAEWLAPVELVCDARLAAWTFQNGAMGHAVALRRTDPQAWGFLMYDNEHRRDDGEAHRVPWEVMGRRLVESRAGILTVTTAAGSALEATVAQRRAARAAEPIQPIMV